MNNVSYASRSTASASAIAGVILFGAVGMTTVSSQGLSSEQIHAIYSAASKPATPEFHALGVAGPTWRVHTGFAAAALSADDILFRASMAFTADLAAGIEPLGNEFAAVLEESFWDLVG